MLGRQEMFCRPTSFGENKKLDELFKRDLFDDLKIAIGLMKDFNDKLNELHPDVVHKIRGLL